MEAFRAIGLVALIGDQFRVAALGKDGTVRAALVSAVSVLETVLGFSGREDFWIIAAIQERR